MATICQHHVRACMHGIRERGIAERSVLERAGINPALLERSDQRIHTEQVARLFKLVQVTLNDEFMGFTQRHSSVGIFATMCELVSRCATLGDLLEKACHFYNLIGDDIPMRLECEGSQASLCFTMRNPQLDPEHFMTEFWLVIWHRFPSWYIGTPIRLRETHFVFPAPRHRDELQIMFPGELQFSAHQNRLIFDRHYLQRPLARTAQELELYLENAPADVMTIPGSDSTLEAQVERLLQSSGRLHFYTIQKVAAELGISVQTLHRHLKQSGTSYQKIKDNLRREVAIQKLVNEKMTVEQVSELVGFTEARSFTRAFKQWTGLTPREYCRQV